MARVRTPLDLGDHVRALASRVGALERQAPEKLVFTAPDGAYIEIGVLDGTGLVGWRLYNSSATLVDSSTTT